MQICDILITHFLHLSATIIFQISTLLINDASLSLQTIYLTQMSLLMKWHKVIFFILHTESIEVTAAVLKQWL